MIPFTSFIRDKAFSRLLLVATLCISLVTANGKSLSALEDSENDTTTYYLDYSDLLALRIYTNTKWNTLEIIHEEEKLVLKPNSPTSLGVGFNFKGFGLGIAFGVPKSSSSNEKYGKTKRLDIQANMYGKKIGLDGFAQLYKGYYNSNPQDFIDWDTDGPYPKLPDMRILSIGVNAFYLFNSDKFSYKAAFVRNQIQQKSAGSFTLGAFGFYDLSRTDNGFIPMEYPDSIKSDFNLKSFSTISAGISVGYLYTWVISKKFFLNIGVTPGFGYQRIELEELTGAKFTKNEPAGQLVARSAFGFDSKFFYAGLTGLIIWRNFEYNGYDLDLSTEQFKVFIGKRIHLKKKSAR